MGTVYVSSNLTVDTNTFHVDVVNKSIGLGTVTPDAELHVEGNVYISSNVTIADTTLSTSKTTGAVKITGGLGVSGNIHATHVNVEDVEADSLTVTDTTVTSSKTTGAVTIAGGLGVSGNIHATHINVEDVEALTVFTDIVGVILTIVGWEDQADQEDDAEDQGNLQEVQTDRRRGISPKPLAAMTSATAITWGSSSRTSPRSRTT